MNISAVLNLVGALYHTHKALQNKRDGKRTADAPSIPMITGRGADSAENV